MIVIRVDLHHAVKGGVTRLFTMTICNTGDHPDRPRRGNYLVRVGRKGQEDLKTVHLKPTRTGVIKDWPRLSRHPAHLVMAAFNAAFPKHK